MTDKPRLIEVAFPLKQASLDSVHEKNVRHGHISTLHIWPARRPLAACRAALIATLLPDPGAGPKPAEMTDDEWQKEVARRRRALCEKIGGKVVQKVEKKAMPNGKTVERIKEETVGGILHWKRETENADDLQWFRDEIRRAYGGRAPKVFDPFAGGGAIPLEAMRLGCEATAIDINPVAWFILKCTLEYPQKLAGQKRPLPEFIIRNREFMEDFFKAQGIKGAALRKQLEKLGFNGKGEPVLEGLKFEDHSLDADLAWHVRAWGQWVLDRARRDLARFYPTYADFEPLKKSERPYQSRPMQSVPLREDGTLDINKLNAEFTADYLADPRNPRWVAKPTVAYLWARTVECKNCRATIPLLKTRWLSRKERNRMLLSMTPSADRTGVTFGVETGVPVMGANGAQRREHDKKISKGTMTRAGADCPCCGLKGVMTMEDIRVRGIADELGAVLTAVVIDTPSGRAYRIPTPLELSVVAEVQPAVCQLFATLPHGPLNEPLQPESTRSISCHLYGTDSFGKVFTPRQQLALGTLVRHVREMLKQPAEESDEVLREAVFAGLVLGVDRVADRMSVFCQPDPSPTQSGVLHTFARFSFPMVWDYIEAVPYSDASGGFAGSLEWVALVFSHLERGTTTAPEPRVLNVSATEQMDDDCFDVILTDPPYYQAISYADLSDYFYVWLRRMLDRPEFASSLSDKSREIVQHVRSDKDQQVEKKKYEDGMSIAFEKAYRSLKDDGRFVVVFAHKEPDAWESLVSAMIRAGFIVTASWPIETERGARSRAIGSASLASSVWLVCKKRPDNCRPGWDNKVLEEMRANIAQQLRNFWDAGIRGPDFVWAATGPAMEAYSKHPVVKKADEPGQVMSVTEFLHHVRRIVVDFVVGRVLSGDGGEDMAAADRLDDVTAYYLLHRHDFGLADAPVGGCILYAISCGLSDSELADAWDIISRTGGSADEEEEEEADPDAEAEAEEGSGSKVRLKTWAQRNRKNMGYEAPGGRPVPLIDRLHRLMHLWRAGEVAKVDEYLDDYGLRRHELFRRLLQSLVELSPAGSDERATLESISNHVGAKGAKPSETMRLPGMETDAESEDQ